MPGGAAILELEKRGEIDDYYDIVEDDLKEGHYGHKLGGWPAFCQPAVEFGKRFEFAIQIASDEKAHINIVDNGNIYLAKNARTGQ